MKASAQPIEALTHMLMKIMYTTEANYDITKIQMVFIQNAIYIFYTAYLSYVVPIQHTF